jgi:hypothetical protein
MLNKDAGTMPLVKEKNIFLCFFTLFFAWWLLRNRLIKL